MRAIYMFFGSKLEDLEPRFIYQILQMRTMYHFVPLGTLYPPPPHIKND